MYPETVAKVLASGKTPAGSHLPIMVSEIIEVLRPAPGELAVDCTLGFGGHSLKLLPLLLPGGRLLGLDADPIELPRTEKRVRECGFAEDAFSAFRCNFAGVAAVLARAAGRAADIILADLGVSSMQIDNPARGFSLKHDGPLDMRMNPNKGLPASEALQRLSAEELESILSDHADEPSAKQLAAALAGATLQSTSELARAVRACLAARPADETELSVRRVFQALRIHVNDELRVLDTLLKTLPSQLAPGGRAAILTFHSGEDRRVKKAFETGLTQGVYSQTSSGVIRAGAAEQRANPRSKSAKLRWAIRAPGHSPPDF
jgi:16S rRNA (cytosine1402-N4)-methyltransferase